MKTILQAVVTAIIQWLSGWFGRRAAARRAQQQAAAVAHTEATGRAAAHQGAQAVETAREKTNEALSTARSAAHQPDGLRRVNQAVRDAIDRANTEGRL